jgi:hypothetical protein
VEKKSGFTPPPGAKVVAGMVSGNFTELVLEVTDSVSEEILFALAADERRTAAQDDQEDAK